MTTPATAPVLDAVHDFGVDPTGKTDSLTNWEACFAAAAKHNQPIHYPGADANSVVSDVLHFGGAPLTLVGDGGRISMMPGRTMPAKNPKFDQQGRHLLLVHDAPSAVLRDVVLDYQGSLQPACVGDVLRFQNVGNVDVAAVRTLNMHGETTVSSAALPETFSLQLLHVDTYLLDGVRAIAADGAQTATGVVAHWCGVGTIRNSLVYGHEGQGFGTYGVAKDGGQLTLQNVDAVANGHGVNIEGGNAGGLVVVLDNVRTSLSSKAALCVNANPARPGLVHALKLHSAADAQLLIANGTADLVQWGEVTRAA